MLGGVAAIGDIKNIWGDLAKVAPEEIKTDTEAARAAWKASEDAAKKGDQLDVLTNTFIGSGPSERGNDCIVQNCEAENAP